MENVGYKLLEMNEKGELFPLFIGKNEETKIGEWIHAKCIPTNNFMVRYGWHIGLIPDAAWLKSYDGSDVGYYKSRWKNGKRVWCLVEFNNENDYTEEVYKLPKKCFIDSGLENGYYKFKESGDRDWIITSDIKVIKIISEEERENILKEMNYDEVAAYKPYKLAMEKRIKTMEDKKKWESLRKTKE